MPILDTKEDRRLRHLRDEHGTYSAAVIYSLETQLAESKADEWNAFINTLADKAGENCITIEAVLDDGDRYEPFDYEISNHVEDWIRSNIRPEPPKERDDE